MYRCPPQPMLSLLYAAISIAVVAKFLNEDKGYIAKSEAAATSEVNVETPKANLFYALVPILPIVILVLGSTILPALKMGVPQAMLIGAIIAIAVTRTNPQDVSKAFFDGMGSAYGNHGYYYCCCSFCQWNGSHRDCRSFYQYVG